jgi:inositol-phosphate phosphatase / L-galactose 1-phosphate phosphatase / histidinol-phosphatase
MSMKTLPDRALELAHRLADVADRHCKQGLSQLNAQALSTEIKADKTFVTALDRAIEHEQRALITATFPDHGIWGEEELSLGLDRPWVWTLDPIDGTMAYVCGMPVYSTLISLCFESIPVLGLMHFPATNERWVGIAGQPTTCNSRVCQTRSSRHLSNAVMSASSPDFFKSEKERMQLASLVSATAWRVYGGAAMSYGRLACGQTDLALDAGLHIYDYAPMIPIIQGAGGMITDWQGQPLNLFSGSSVLACSHPDLHAKALELLNTPLALLQRQ